MFSCSDSTLIFRLWSRSGSAKRPARCVFHSFSPSACLHRLTRIASDSVSPQSKPVAKKPRTTSSLQFPFAPGRQPSPSPKKSSVKKMKTSGGRAKPGSLLKAVKTADKGKAKAEASAPRSANPTSDDEYYRAYGPIPPRDSSPAVHGTRKREGASPNKDRSKTSCAYMFSFLIGCPLLADAELS